jgi:maltose operon protein
MVSYRSAVENLRSAPSCCVSFAQFKYEALPGGTVIRFNLDASSNAFDFRTGKSYFKAFMLPEKALPCQLQITSWALGEHINKAHIFYPQVAVLDADFAVVSQSAPGDFILSKASVGETLKETGGLPVKIEGSLTVDDPRAKFVVVYTTPELMESTSRYAVRQAIPIVLPGMVTAIPGPETEVSIRHSPFGLLRIRIAPG